MNQVRHRFDTLRVLAAFACILPSVQSHVEAAEPQQRDIIHAVAEQRADGSIGGPVDDTQVNLGRYHALGLLDDLRERTTRQPEPGQTLRTLWVLVPAEDPDALPAIAGQAIPTTSSAERLALPDSWIDNVHRTIAPAGSPAP